MLRMKAFVYFFAKHNSEFAMKNNDSGLEKHDELQFVDGKESKINRLLVI